MSSTELEEQSEKERNETHCSGMIIALTDTTPVVAPVPSMSRSDVTIPREMSSRSTRGTDERDGTVASFVVDVDLSTDETLRVGAVSGAVTVFCQLRKGAIVSS